MKHFLEVFIPLFVTIDVIGLIPVFLAVTPEMEEKQRRTVAVEGVISAGIISLGFMFVGNQLFAFLGIQPAHFMIAGGVILLVLAVLDIVLLEKPAMDPAQVRGAVPLGMPLIAGPGTLSTVLLLASNPRYGYAWTALSLSVNLAILLVGLILASRIGRLVGINVMRALSKLIMVLLAAIAVSFVAQGVQGLLKAP